MSNNDESTCDCCFRISAMGENGYIEILGAGNMNVAPVLKDVCYAMIDEKKKRIFLNLEQCGAVDSTFMGTLVNIKERFERVGIDEGRLLVMNMNSEHKRLFKMVGIDSIIDTLSDEVEVPDFSLKEIDTCDVDRAEKLRVVVEAHERLIQLNDINKDKFDRFLNIVKQEMSEDGIMEQPEEDHEDRKETKNGNEDNSSEKEDSDE